MDATTRTLLYVGGVGGVAYVLLRWRSPVAPVQIALDYVTNIVGRGNKLSDGTLVDGVVQEIPEVLQDMATAVLGVQADPNTLALARMGRSEGVDGMEIRMHVALNDLANLQRVYGYGVYSSMLALMTHSKIARADGHFSAQNLGKRYSTARDPFEADYALAQKVESDRANGIDLASGATKFVDKSGFGVQTGTGSYEDTAASWAAQGYVAQNVDGASSNFVIFVPAVG